MQVVVLLQINHAYSSANTESRFGKIHIGSEEAVVRMNPSKMRTLARVYLPATRGA
ncbi:MAG: hypothetical protein ACJAYI_001408 [Myxococcota bacterium]|jgi:hypothetical protein